MQTKENNEAKLMSTFSFVSFNKNNKLYHSVTYSMIRPGGKSRGGMVGKPDSRINGKILFERYKINWKFLLLSFVSLSLYVSF